MKKLSEPQKVKLLEQTTKNGSLEELKEILDSYQPFECMANALGIAADQRGVAFVELLASYGATFWYPYDGAWNRKYGLYWKGGTSSGFHFSRHYLMSKSTLPLDEKLAVVKFLMAHPELKASADEILYTALMRCDLDFADGLMKMGINLNQTPPGYFYGGYFGQCSEAATCAGTYLMILTNGLPGIYWMDYGEDLSILQAEQLLPVLTRLHKLAEADGKKLVLTAPVFEKLNWDSASLAFAAEHMDLSRVEKNTEQRQFALQKAILLDCVPALSYMVEQGWHRKPEQLMECIRFATEHQSLAATAWLMDYSKRTLDMVALEAKMEKKLMKELTEDPNSVSALKKIWAYEKLEDGTLVITAYKGQDIEVVVPDRIGKNTVSAIGERAFSPEQLRIKNRDVRNEITEVVLPEGVTTIAACAFKACSRLNKVSIPAGVTRIGDCAFGWWTEDLVIHAPAGSYAIQYAKEHKIRYRSKKEK